MYSISIARTLLCYSVLLTAFANAVEGGGHEHGTHKECALPESTLDVIECSTEFHPLVMRQKLVQESSKTLTDVAKQRPNPILSTRNVKGETQGSEVYESESSLLVPIELGGKRESRIEQAQAHQAQIDVKLKAAQAKVMIETILNLHRLRQIEAERKVLKQELELFQKVDQRLSKLPRLSPDQEATESLLEIAAAEAKVRQSVLFEEERKIEHFFHVATGHSLKEIKPVLPKPPKDWPRIKALDEEDAEIKDSPSLAILKADVKEAQARFEVEKSNAWPDLKIGPSLQYEKGPGGPENRLLGVNLSLPLPVFHANQAGKAHARAEVVRARKLRQLTRKEERHERSEQLKVYNSAVRVLKTVMGNRRIQKQRKKVEDLYLRGLVSSSVLIESQRKRSELIKSRHNRELKALKALWSIYYFDGKIFEEKI